MVWSQDSGETPALPLRQHIEGGNCMRGRKVLKWMLIPLAALVAVALLLPPSQQLDAADHGDAPLTAHDLGADLNDVYFFKDPTDNSRVILIMTVHGFIVPGENSNFGIFDPALRYRFG